MDIFIYGGCATRDSVDYFSQFGFRLVDYVARQSIVSTFAPSDPAQFDFSAVPSSFQRRMYEGDVLGDLISKIRSAEPLPNVVLWDINIERVGYQLVPGGGCVTRSINHAAKTWRGRGRLGEWVKFGTDRHFEQWAKAARNFVDALAALAPETQLIVNRTPWAEVSEAVTGANGQSVDWFNEATIRYFDWLTELEIRQVTAKESDVVSDVDHKWGPAPFHYQKSTYVSMLREVARITGARM